MKTVLVFVAILALIHADTIFVHPASHLVPQVEDPDMSDVEHLKDIGAQINGTLVNLNTYFNAIWSYFGLVQHSVIECFNPFTAQDYFQFMDARYKLANATTNANAQGVVQYAALVQVYNATMSQVYGCVENTQDYVDLLIAVGANVFNKTLQATLDLVYFDGHINDWLLVMAPVWNNYYAQNFSNAGNLYGQLLQQQYANMSYSQLFFMATKGTLNGLFFYNNISLPYVLPNCFNNTSGQNDIAFLFYWARTVNQSNLANVINNTDFYFQTAGGQLLWLLQDAWTCENATNDETKLDEAIGYVLHGYVFDHAIYNYWNDPLNSLDYIITFTEIFSALSTVNTFGAGSFLAKFYNQVALYIGPTAGMTEQATISS